MPFTSTDPQKAVPAKKRGKAADAPVAPARPIMLTLPVKLTATRRAVLGEELAMLNGTHRDLQAAKKDASKRYSAQISAVELRSVPIEEALKMKGERVVPLSVQCEARPVPGQPTMLDVFRMDTDPPTFVKRIPAPTLGDQVTLPGIDAPAGPSQEEMERQFADEIAKALGTVPFPDEEDGDGDVTADDAASGEDAPESAAPPAAAPPPVEDEDEDDPYT